MCHLHSQSLLLVAVLQPAHRDWLQAAHLTDAAACRQSATCAADHLRGHQVAGSHQLRLEAEQALYQSATLLAAVCMAKTVLLRLAAHCNDISGSVGNCGNTVLVFHCSSPGCTLCTRTCNHTHISTAACRVKSPATAMLSTHQLQHAEVAAHGSYSTILSGPGSQAPHSTSPI